MSAGVVILMFLGEPITTQTLSPSRSTRDASSVPMKPSCRRAVKGAFDQFIAEALGVCAWTTRSRGMVDVMIAPFGGPFDLLDRVHSGQAGNRGACFSTSCTTLAMISSSTNGRNGIQWTRTTSSAEAFNFASALATDSCRCSPPSTMVTLSASFFFFQLAAETFPSSFLRSATTIWLTCWLRAKTRSMEDDGPYR